jgi:hypothetical protein
VVIGLDQTPLSYLPDGLHPTRVAVDGQILTNFHDVLQMYLILAPLWRQNDFMMHPARTTSDRSCATLRLDQGIGERIDRARMRRPGNISRNTWITEAILEKLERDEQREE